LEPSLGHLAPIAFSDHQRHLQRKAQLLLDRRPSLPAPIRPFMDGSRLCHPGQVRNQARRQEFAQLLRHDGQVSANRVIVGLELWPHR
jgi:hypothetical protein